ncbi:ISAzo13-like element transposase-related protein [Pseudanabaena cinerea]|uniref:ISAzo13-like element transposase-related protein n=1 Tax=Pseudanabaena cinerea TaxID=2661616 RepID=UPI0018F03A24
MYAFATSILFLCDGGGSNSANYYIFKEDLQKFAKDIGIEIRIAHYHPYTSKYNPIEHRLLPHVTRACEGMHQLFLTNIFLNGTIEPFLSMHKLFISYP